MFGKLGMIESFYGEYKTGIFGKKTVSLYVYDETIEGIAAIYAIDKFKEYSFNVKYEDIKAIEERNILGNKCMSVDYLDGKTIVKDDRINTLVFPNLEHFDEAKEMLISVWEKNKEKQERKWQEEKERRDRQLLMQQQHEKECQMFYDNCYGFHISNDNNPYYELQRESLQFAAIYVDKNNNLNFVKIDGGNQEESNACIPYEKIHYYERAGSVHYTTDINGKYSHFGGSLTGATVSKAASIVGGLLFGPMGMATGALLTHKPMKKTDTSTSFSISSETHKIDDRSVILNYYSDKKQQFMDIELPADIYNFLQTHLPERKYGIVLEIEKKNAVKSYEESNALQVQEQKAKNIETHVDDTEQFESRIKKLKIMYDQGILSDEEYANEKKRILSEI